LRYSSSDTESGSYSYPLQFLRQTSTEEDSDVLRQLQLDHIHLSVHKTFDALESIAQELQILKMARPSPPSHPQAPVDQRQRNGHADGYSERLDDLSRLSRPGGPILDGQGKPLRPFTLLDKRTQFREGVFRPDHNLPTMTIDEYLEEERRRGGIIEGGGPQSGLREQVDEDDMDKADEETMKARAWDEFKEANPRGSGNTLNKG
jgi:immunoglobulin-binding protein 1